MAKKQISRHRSQTPPKTKPRRAAETDGRGQKQKRRIVGGGLPKTNGDTSYREPVSADSDFSGEDWDDPSAITVGAGGDADCPMGHHDESSLLLATDYRFAQDVTGSSQVPIGSTITGIEVTVRANNGTTGHIQLCELMLSKTADGTPAPNSVNKASGEVLPSAATDIVKGGSTDLWGTTWSASEIRDDNKFGVIVRLENYDGSSVENGTVVAVKVKIYYTT